LDGDVEDVIPQVVCGRDVVQRFPDFGNVCSLLKKF
jgi:hypothetical protein